MNLKDLLRKRDGLLAERSRPDALLELDGAIAQAQALAAAEQAARAEARLIELGKLATEIDEAILVALEAVIATFGPRRALDYEAASLGGALFSRLTASIWNMPAAVEQVRAQQASDEDERQRRRLFPKFELAEVDAQEDAYRATMARRKNGQPGYQESQAQHQTDKDILEGFAYRRAELRDPGRHARERAKAEAQAERQAPRTVAEADARDAEEAARMAEQSRTVATFN